MMRPVVAVVGEAGSAVVAPTVVARRVLVAGELVLGAVLGVVPDLGTMTALRVVEGGGWVVAGAVVGCAGWVVEETVIEVVLEMVV
ncbi:MAG: hypothetical protein GY773_30720, partial [Actinomycetia bacterium]|nr:hypothetical protein [Actinomycetes bacterium]